MILTPEIAIQTGTDKELIAKAKKYMLDNGYQISPSGKMVACNDLRDLIDDKNELLALQTAIMSIEI